MCDNAEKYFDSLKECKTAHFSLSLCFVGLLGTPLGCNGHSCGHGLACRLTLPSKVQILHNSSDSCTKRNNFYTIAAILVHSHFLRFFEFFHFQPAL